MKGQKKEKGLPESLILFKHCIILILLSIFFMVRLFYLKIISYVLKNILPLKRGGSPVLYEAAW